MIEFFAPMIPPTTTHNDLEVRKRGNGHFIGKSDELQEVEAKYLAHLAPHAPSEPLSGPIALEMRSCWPTEGKHPQGAPHDVKPDADNVEKTIWDVMAKLGYYENDCRIALHTTAKLWSDPAGLYVRMEEI